MRSPSASDKHLPKADTDVFDRVMGVNLQVSFSMELQIEKPMHGKERQHVIQKGNPGLEVHQTLSINEQLEVNIRFFGLAINLTCPHGFRPFCQWQKAKSS